MNVEVLNSYCMECKEWVQDKDSHDCPTEHLIIADKEMIGIAGRLYAMGITPMVALWTKTEMSTETGGIVGYEYLLSLRIDISKRIYEAILGELPKGWEYHWETVAADKTELHLLRYTEMWYYFGFESVDERLEMIIKEFEAFLDTRDAAATKALLLLTYY